MSKIFILYSFCCFEDLNDVRPFQNALAFKSGREDADTQPTIFNDDASGFFRALQMGAPFFD
jgi:hypothetical protein